jgi:hypothetical protein
MKIEARFEELNARFNSERAERLQNMHRMNKEQVATPTINITYHDGHFI